MIHDPLPLPAGNYMCLPDHCPYTDYLYISTIRPLANLYMSASRGEIYQRQQDRVCVPMPGAGDLRPRSGRFLSQRVLKLCYLLPSHIPITFLFVNLDPYSIVFRIAIAGGLCSGAAGAVDLENVGFLKVSNRNFKVCKLLYGK